MSRKGKEEGGVRKPGGMWLKELVVGDRFLVRPGGASHEKEA